MQVLGFDFGMKHIGIAVGQTLTKTASPVTVVPAKDGIPNWEDIKKILEHWQPKALVVGIPINMDDTEQLLTFCAKRFANRLKTRFQLPVHFVDERLSTWEARNRVLKKGSYKTEKRAKKEIHAINSASAVIILEQWLVSNTK